MVRARNISLVLCFAAMLVAPTVATLFNWNPFGAIDEKRVLAKKPEFKLWSRDTLAKAPAIAQAWEKYFGENFGLRKLLIGSYRLATFHLLRTSPNPAVVVGQSDGERRWLYLDAAVTGDGIGLESVLGKKPYVPAQLGVIAEQLRQVASLLRAKGIKLIVAVCPDKQTLYPEYLPRALRPAPGSVSRLDQFWAMAATLDSVPLVDLRDPLKQSKSKEQLYYPSDTHWNWRGGVLAYQAIARVLEAQDPSRTVLPVDRIQWLLGPPRVGDLSMLMGLPGIGGDLDWLPSPTSLAAMAGPKRGRLLVIADSFFDFVQPFFDLQFEHITKLALSHEARTAVLVPGFLDIEKPDVVIIQSVERYWTMD